MLVVVNIAAVPTKTAIHMIILRFFCSLKILNSGLGGGIKCSQTGTYDCCRQQL